MTPQGDSSKLTLLRRPLDSEDESAAEEINHPSLNVLRTHIALCERCPVGAPCATGDVLRSIYGEVKARLRAAQRWEEATTSD
jgi:hypothetical protein